MKIRTVSIVIFGLVIVSNILLFSCKKEITKESKHHYPAVDSCAKGFDLYTTSRIWPERDWECNNACVFGCDYPDRARTYNYLSVFFNQSNPYQISFNRINYGTREESRYIFDFCNGQLTDIGNKNYFLDWGNNNLLLYYATDNSVRAKNAFDDSVIVKFNFPSNQTIVQHWSPSNYILTYDPHTTAPAQVVDVSKNVIHNFIMPGGVREINWVGDDKICYFKYTSRGDTICVMDLNTNIETNLCYVSQELPDTTIPLDGRPIKLCYNPNNNSVYWISRGYIMRVNVVSKEKQMVRRCYSSLSFIEISFSPTIGKMVLRGVELNLTSLCLGSMDFSLYLMNEDGTDLRHIDLPE